MDALFYVRGSGHKVIICHSDDVGARALMNANWSAGVTLYKDKRGFIYAYVCEY